MGELIFGRPALVLTLLASALAAVAGGCSGSEAFFQAIRDDKVDVVESMCKARPSLVKALDENGATGLNWAAEFGRPDIARVLIKAGSDLHHDGPLTGMPLHAAADRGYEDIIKMLLEAGADVNRQPEKKSSHSEGTALHCAVMGDRPGIVRMLLEHKADPNAIAKNHFHLTPMHRAANNDPSLATTREIIELLLKYGADINARDEFGDTPLFSAKQTPRAAKGDLRIVEFLIKKGAKEFLPEEKDSSTDRGKELP